MDDKPLETLIAELKEEVKLLEKRIKQLEQENKFMEELNICLQQKHASPDTRPAKDIWLLKTAVYAHRRKYVGRVFHDE